MNPLDVNWAAFAQDVVAALNRIADAVERVGSTVTPEPLLRPLPEPTVEE